MGASQSGDCTTECATSLCAGQAPGPGLSQDCNHCIDQRLASQQCGPVIQARCGAACKGMQDCLVRTCGL